MCWYGFAHRTNKPQCDTESAQRCITMLILYSNELTIWKIDPSQVLFLNCWVCCKSTDKQTDPGSVPFTHCAVIAVWPTLRTTTCHSKKEHHWAFYGAVTLDGRMLQLDIFHLQLLTSSPSWKQSTWMIPPGCSWKEAKLGRTCQNLCEIWSCCGVFLSLS